MLSSLNATCHGKLPNRDGRIAPHLNVGLHDEISVAPKTKTKLERLQALFDSREYVTLADAMVRSRNISLICDIANNRGFEKTFTGANMLSGFRKPHSNVIGIEKDNAYPVGDKNFGNVKIDSETLIDLMLVEVSKAGTITPSLYSDYKDHVIAKAITSVRKVLQAENKYLDTIRKKREGRGGCGQVDYYRLVTIVGK